MCPECQLAVLVLKQATTVETHGLDCGPYERVHEEWWECPACEARLTEEDLRALTDPPPG